MDLLILEISSPPPRPEPAAEAGLLEASPRRFHVSRLHVVDPDDSGAEGFHRAHGLENVPRPNGSGQAVRRIVSNPHRVFFVLEWNHRGNGAKDFFAGDRKSR